MMTRARFAAAGVLTALIVSIGCNSANPDAPCHIQGKVTYNGNPVTGGFVLFHQSDGNKVSLPIFANGSYTGDLKEGTYSVTVDTESLNPNKKTDSRAPGGAGGAYGGAAGGNASGGGYASKYKAQQASPTPEGAGPKPEYVKIPPKYMDPSSSGLSFTAKRGKNEYDIKLTD